MPVLPRNYGRTRVAFATNSKNFGEGAWQAWQQVGGGHALDGPAGLSQPQLGRAAVRPGSGAGGVVGGHAAREQGADRAGEYVSGAGGGERRGAGGVDRGPAALDHQRVVALKEHARPALFGSPAREVEPAGGDVSGALSQEPPELPGVRRDGGGGAPFCEGLRAGEVGDGVGVEQDGEVRAAQDAFDEPSSPLSDAGGRAED